MTQQKTANSVTTLQKKQLQEILQDPEPGDLEARIIAWANSIFQEVAAPPPGQVQRIENIQGTHHHQNLGSSVFVESSRHQSLGGGSSNIIRAGEHQHIGTVRK